LSSRGNKRNGRSLGGGVSWRKRRVYKQIMLEEEEEEDIPN
jgi:hypothetical protein